MKQDSILGRTDAEKVARYDAMVVQNRKHVIWYGELQDRIKELEAELATNQGAVSALHDIRASILNRAHGPHGLDDFDADVVRRIDATIGGGS